jgi:hypothetical protein
VYQCSRFVHKKQVLAGLRRENDWELLNKWWRLVGTILPK